MIMKKLFGRIFCLALCAFALICGAAMAEPVFTMNSNGYITHVSMEPETEALEIPDKIGGSSVRGVAAGVFDDYPYLKYVWMQASKLKDFASNSLDFSSAENLECIFISTEATNIILRKFKTSGAEILQYVDTSSLTLTVAPITYENGAVRLTFDDIGSFYMIDYRVTRTEQNSSTSVSFDSAADHSYFYISNGTVRFTDITADPGKTYDYYIETMYPFWHDNGPSYTTSISIPDDDLNENSDKNPDEQPLPETGDGANLVLWTVLAAMSAAGMMIVRRKKEASRA